MLILNDNYKRRDSDIYTHGLALHSEDDHEHQIVVNLKC